MFHGAANVCIPIPAVPIQQVLDQHTCCCCCRCEACSSQAGSPPTEVSSSGHGAFGGETTITASTSIPIPFFASPSHVERDWNSKHLKVFGFFFDGARNHRISTTWPGNYKETIIDYLYKRYPSSDCWYFCDDTFNTNLNVDRALARLGEALSALSSYDPRTSTITICANFVVDVFGCSHGGTAALAFAARLGRQGVRIVLENDGVEGVWSPVMVRFLGVVDPVRTMTPNIGVDEVEEVTHNVYYFWDGYASSGGMSILGVWDPFSSFKPVLPTTPGSAIGVVDHADPFYAKGDPNGHFGAHDSLGTHVGGICWERQFKVSLMAHYNYLSGKFPTYDGIPAWFRFQANPDPAREPTSFDDPCTSDPSGEATYHFKDPAQIARDAIQYEQLMPHY